MSASINVTRKKPFAAVLPVTPLMTTKLASARPCPTDVMTMGDVLDASVMVLPAPSGSTGTSICVQVGVTSARVIGPGDCPAAGR